MKLLRDEFLFAIKVDYYMWSEEKGDYTEPVYLSIDTETKRKDGTPLNLITFNKKITDCLRVFDTERDAISYINMRIINSCYSENPRVVKIRYNFKRKMWEEM